MSDALDKDPFAKPELEQPDVQIDTPVNLRPDLSLFGIEETDRGVCLDTFENRQALRRAKFNWLPVYAVNGKLSHSIVKIFNWVSNV